MSEALEKDFSDQSQGKDSNSLDQDEISRLIDEMQSEENVSLNEQQADTNSDGSEKESSERPEDESDPIPEQKTENIEQNEIEEKAESRQQDENSVGKEEKSAEKSNEKTEEDKDGDKEKEGFKGLDADDEIEIDGDPDIEKDKSDNGDNHKKNMKNDEDKESEKNDSGEQPVKLKEVKKRPKGKRFKLFISCIICVVIISIIFGVYPLLKKSGTDNIESEKAFQTDQVTKPKSKYGEEQNPPQLKDNETQVIILNDSMVAKLNEITELRNELLIKEREIADLIINYNHGISEMEDEILRVKQGEQMDSFNAAIKNKKIEFGLMTIQRRLAYIEKVDPPYKWLNQGIEELRYLKQKIEIDAQINRIISGINMDKMIQEIDMVIHGYRTGIQQLKIDMNKAAPITLEMIWERIKDKEKFAASNNQKSDEPSGENLPDVTNLPAVTNEEKNNRMIWEEICSGNFTKKDEMTKLSTDAAKCLSQWKHADLFLNGISDLSPGAARNLLKWKGDWICLNGVKKLSSESAKYLFQWQGDWISLNGLSEISSWINYLTHWQGKQLELMGLKYQRSESERVALKSLVKWEKSGGKKLFIPMEVRKAIKHIY